MSHDLNYHHLRYFWAVAHEGNLTRAAERLHVSQSAVSVQIKKLEEQLGHELYERRGKQLVLTDAGRTTLDYADTIFDTGDELIGVLSERSEPTRASLRVGVLATLSRNFQLSFLEPLMKRDDVELLVQSGTLAEMLERLEGHRIDVVLANVVSARDESTPWIPHLIAEQPVSLIGRPGMRRRRRLESLLRQESLVVPTVDSSIRTGFDALVNELGIQPRIFAQVDDMAMLRLVARSHDGLSVIPPIVVKDELDQGVLTEVARLPGLAETFFAITVPRRRENPLLRELLTLAKP